MNITTRIMLRGGTHNFGSYNLCPVPTVDYYEDDVCRSKHAYYGMYLTLLVLSSFPERIWVHQDRYVTEQSVLRLYTWVWAPESSWLILDRDSSPSRIYGTWGNRVSEKTLPIHRLTWQKDKPTRKENKSRENTEGSGIPLSIWREQKFLEEEISLKSRNQRSPWVLRGPIQVSDPEYCMFTVIGCLVLICLCPGGTVHLRFGYQIHHSEHSQIIW